jgi:diguanylate cyclase (GGDEF)-like protein
VNVQRIQADRLRQLLAPEALPSAIAGDFQAHLWKRVRLLRYLAAVVVALALSLEVSGQYRLLAAILPLVGVVLTVPVQRLAMRDDRWGVTILVVDCIGLSLMALLAPDYFALCIAILIGSLALLAAAGGRTGLRIGLLVSLPLVAAAVTLRSPQSGVALLLIVMLSGVSLSITTRHGEQVRLRASTEFHELIDSMGIAFWLADRDNDVPHTIVGDLGKPVGRDNDFYFRDGAWIDAVHPDDRAKLRAADLESRRGRHHITRYRELHVDGTYRWLEDDIRVEMSTNGRLVGTRGIRRDVTHLVNTEAVAEQFSRFVDALDDGVILGRIESDEAITLLAFNASIGRLLIGQLDGMVGQNVNGFFAKLFQGTPSASGIAQVRELFLTRKSGTVQVELYIQDSSPRTFDISVVVLSADTLAIVLVDVTTRLATQAALSRRASTDELTGLINRVEFRDQLRTALAERGDQPVTVLLLDLDQFKYVNDSFGHTRGDQLLVAVGQRISSLVPPGARLARLGGDEFAVLLPTHDTVADGVALAHWLTESFNEGFVLNDLTLHVGASMGIASAPDHAETLETLIARADVAMYLAKARGGGHAIYDPALDTSSARRVVLLGDLRRALAEGEIICHFQPIVDRTGTLVQAESLVRWQHPDLGMIMPGEFIDLTEMSSLSEPLAMTVLRNALRQYGLLREFGVEIGLSVNLSPGNLMNIAFVEEFCREVESASLPPGALTVEITERTLSGRLAIMLPSLHKLRDLCVRVALDDFGAGETSLALLRSLPLDHLKIDKMLVDDFASGSEAIVRAIIDLSHELGLQVVAEGVETADVYTRLIDIGCDRIQGYHVARPMSGIDLLHLVRTDA